MSEKQQKGSLLGQAWLVLCLALVFGGCLAAMELGLKERIRENQKNETFDQIDELVPGAGAVRSAYAPFGEGIIKAVSDGGEHRGWVIGASGQGFADVIKVLIGLDTRAETITGIYVLEQKETPGLGDYITDPGKFRKYYAGQPTAEPLEVIKREPAREEKGKIKALTGATVSSKAVTGIVNERVNRFKAELFRHNHSGGE